jgi:two-component sensor histidine kinase
MLQLLTADCGPASHSDRLPTSPKRLSIKGFKQVVFLGLMLVATNLSAQNPYIQHYTTHDGLPSNTVYYIYQDSKKFIWFATDAGVVRYDGTTFKNYRTNDGVSSNNVIRIKEDSNGRIWFFNFNGSLNYFYQNRIYNGNDIPFLDSLQVREFIIDFCQDTDQTIYFYNRLFEIITLDSQNNFKRFDLHDKLFKYSLKSNSCISHIPEVFRLRYLCKNSSGDFLFFTDCAIIKLPDLFGTPSLFNGSFGIFTVFPGSKQIKYIDTESKFLYKFDDDHLEKIIPIPDYSFGNLTSILEDKDGSLWISYYSKGVYCLKNDLILKHFNIQETQAILQDNENNIWVSSMKEGVYKISPYIFDHRYYEKGLFQDKGITALGPEINGAVWLTNGQSVYLFKNNEFSLLNFKDQDNNSFNWICQLNNGTLMIGQKRPVFYFFKGFRENILPKQIKFQSTGRLKYAIKKINIDRTGEEISYFGTVSIIIGTPDKLFRENKEIILSQRIYNTFYNLNNELVVNANNNYLIRNNKFEPCIELCRFNNKIITDHLIMNDTSELYNVEGDSIYLYTKHNFFNLTTAFGSSIDLQIRKIIYHPPALYLSTFRNIYKCDNPLNIIDNKPVQLQLLDINFRNIQDILINKDSLYIASDDGLTIIPEVMINKITVHTPIPYFKSILINDKETDLSGQELVLRSNNKITFNFSCINYSSTPIHYSYKMDGLDTAWTTGPIRIVVYQNVSRGNYTFHLKVRKPGSEWSKSIECRVTVKAPFWQHPLFYLGLSILCVSLLILYIIRRKNIQMKKRELDNQLITLEQKALQSMMNPHFIFNSLGSIQTYLLQNKSGEAGLYLSQFARLIRQNLNAINASSINLEEEIDRLKNYLDLEKLRMEDKFEYHIEVAANIETDELQIPSMIIQPFVENAIWHGIAFLKEKGQIIIRFLKKDDKSLDVIIEDNGIGMKRSETFSANKEKRAHLGMELARKRLEILGRKFSVRTCLKYSELFPGNPNPGTRVELVVPIGL